MIHHFVRLNSIISLLSHDYWRYLNKTMHAIIAYNDTPFLLPNNEDVTLKSFIDVFYHQIRNGIQGYTTRAPPLPNQQMDPMQEVLMTI